MDVRHRYFSAVVASVVLLASSVFAQHAPRKPPRAVSLPLEQQQSHQPLEGDFSVTEEQLLSRLSRSRDLQRMQKLAQDLLGNRELLDQLQRDLKPGDLERLQKKAQSDPNSLLNDPALRSLVDHLGQNGRISSADLELFRRLVPNTPQSNLSDPPPRPQPPDGPMPQPVQPTPPPGVAPPGPPAAGNNQASGRSGSWWSRQIRRLSERVKDLDADDRAALTELLRQFGRGGGGDLRLDPSAGGRWPGMARWLTRVGEYVPMDRIRPRDLLSAARGWQLPSWPRPGNSGGATIGTGPLLAGDQIATSVLWILAGIAVAIFAWKFFESYRVAATHDAGALALGPWPVDPGAVQSRAEVVQAFEYLAIRNLGPGARPCHHRTLAERLGASVENDGREAARRLGALYELARYAPPDATLTDVDFAQVLRDLSVLAEGPAA